jgi:hypothetical protein
MGSLLFLLTERYKGTPLMSLPPPTTAMPPTLQLRQFSSLMGLFELRNNVDTLLKDVSDSFTHVDKHPKT